MYQIYQSLAYKLYNCLTNYITSLKNIPRFQTKAFEKNIRQNKETEHFERYKGYQNH